MSHRTTHLKNRLVLTLTPGVLDDATHSQPGICKLLHLISEEDVTIVYLTSRPIVMAAKTRAFLMGLKQDGHLLPIGPLFLCASKVRRLLLSSAARNTREMVYYSLTNFIFVFYDGTLLLWI